MYYLIKGRIEDEFGGGTFEWIVEAATQEKALAKLEEGEQCESIREISVEERIEREERELLTRVKGEYFFHLFKDVPIREANKKSRELEANPENYYIALAEFNKKQRLVCFGYANIRIQVFCLVNPITPRRIEAKPI